MQFKLLKHPWKGMKIICYDLSGVLAYNVHTSIIRHLAKFLSSRKIRCEPCEAVKFEDILDVMTDLSMRVFRDVPTDSNQKSGRRYFTVLVSGFT